VVQKSGVEVWLVVLAAVPGVLTGIVLGCLAGWRAHSWVGLLVARPDAGRQTSTETGSRKGKGGIWLHEQLAVQR